MRTFFKGLTISFLSILFLATCNSEDGPIRTGKIQFNFARQSKPDQPNGRQNSGPETASVMLSIQQKNGAVVHDMLKLTLLSFGSGFVTESVELPVGEYKLTSFLILDSDNNISYACPMEGSAQSDFVTDALPIDFDVTENGTATVAPQVLQITPQDDPGSFGYINFGFEIIEPTVTDIENNIYSVVKIGDQHWLGENLKTTKFQNGDEIPTTIPATLDISSESNPKYQWDNGIYGRLYTQYVASDSRNVCPTGWRVPSQNDYLIMMEYLIQNGHNYGPVITGVVNKLGKAMASDSLWIEVPSVHGAPGNNQETNNTSGFNGLPSGVRVNLEDLQAHPGYSTYWWTNEEGPNGSNIAVQIQGSLQEVYVSGIGYVNTGAPIRCIKEN